MGNFSERLRDGMEFGGFDVYLSIENDELCMEVTDGDYDRSWKLNKDNTKRFLSAVGGIEKLLLLFPKPEFEMGNTDKFIASFKSACEKHKIKYEYTSYMSGSAFDR